MAHILPYALAYLFPLSMVLGLSWGGVWIWSTVALGFLVTPVLEPLLGLDKENPGKEKAPVAWLLDAGLFIWIPFQALILFWALNSLAFGVWSLLEKVGLVLSLGTLTGGLGITIAHELMHRQGKLHRAGAEILMTMVSYPWFCVEHVLGHHRNVATPLDPASSRLGESLYRYLPRTIFGGLLSAWKLESRRVAKRRIPAWSLRDRRFRYGLDLALLYLLVGATIGAMGIFFLVAQSLVSIVLLEAINYVEHYGLNRKEIAPGRFERVQPHHSWNSAHRLTGLYLFSLPRHSDHHFLASRPFYQLRHFEDVPQLPAGYATMVLAAFIPPLWHHIMEPQVAEWRERFYAAPDKNQETLVRAA